MALKMVLSSYCVETIITDHGHESCCQSNQRTYSNHHQCQLPSSNEAHQKTKDKCKNPLNKDSHLICYSIVDFVNITETKYTENIWYITLTTKGTYYDLDVKPLGW